MTSLLKIWSVLMFVTLSFHLAKATELPTHGIPLTEASFSSELAQNINFIQKQIAELNAMQDAMANEEDTHGLMSAIGQTVEQAETSLKHIRKSSDLQESRETIQSLSSMKSDFKAMDPLNQILGLHVNGALKF